MWVNAAKIALRAWLRGEVAGEALERNARALLTCGWRTTKLIKMRDDNLKPVLESIGVHTVVSFITLLPLMHTAGHVASPLRVVKDP
jgi:hypothetical protein